MFAADAGDEEVCSMLLCAGADLHVPQHNRGNFDVFFWVIDMHSPVTCFFKSWSYFGPWRI